MLGLQSRVDGWKTFNKLDVVVYYAPDHLGNFVDDSRTGPGRS